MTTIGLQNQVIYKSQIEYSVFTVYYWTRGILLI